MIAAGHDGAAELVVTLRFEHGGESRVTLDGTAGRRLLENCGVTQISELAGHSWRGILEEATCST